MKTFYRHAKVASSLALAPAILVLASSQALSETIGASVGSALRDSPRVLRAVERARQAVAEIGEVRARQRPNISFEAIGGSAYRDRSVDGLSTGTGDVIFARRAVLSLQQLLFDSGASAKLVRSARIRKDYEALLVEDARQEEGFFVAETYMDVIGSRLKAGIMAEKIGFLQKYHAFAAKAKGMTEANTQEAVIQGKIYNARADFEKITARANALECRFELLTNHSPSGLSIPPKLPDLSDKLLALSGPKLLAAKASVDAQNQNLQALQKDLYPSLYLQMQAAGGRDVAGISGPDNEFAALAVFRWNIFDGGKTRASITKAKALLAEELAAVDDVRSAIQDRVRTASAEREGAEKRFQDLAASIGTMSGAVAKHEEIYAKDSKQVGPLSVINVYNELSSVRMELVDANIDRYVESYRVLAASGNLLRHFGIRSPDATGAVDPSSVSSEKIR